FQATPCQHRCAGLTRKSLLPTKSIFQLTSTWFELCVCSCLFVVSDNGFEQVLESFVSFYVILARDLEQQPLERVQAAQRMPRDGIGQPGPQHHELVLTVGFRRANGTSHRVIQTAKLALGAAVHIAHASHDHMRLVVQVQAIGNQFLQLDFREPVKGSAAAGPAFMAPFWSASTLTTATGTTIVATRT